MARENELLPTMRMFLESVSNLDLFCVDFVVHGMEKAKGLRGNEGQVNS